MAEAEDTKLDEELAQAEPQLTSKDPNERKLARRLRIERRWENIQRLALEEEEGPTVVEETKGEIQLQVQRSAELLEKYLHEGEEFITNVRVANDGREVDRRDLEGIGREKIIEQLESEAKAAQDMFDEIAEKWSEIEKYNDPLHINEDIMNQKERCDALIKQKDGIIAMLKEEIRKAERKFSKDQDKQMQDINTLAKRIEKQVMFMRRAYQKEFEVIEEVILGERKKLIDMNNKKWDELHKKRDQEEVSNSDKKFEQLEEFEDNMTKLRVDFQEKYRETKIHLENDIEDLQKELERIKALALLNSEKLDYNYQILKKREDENIIIKSQQKRRLNKLQDFITSLRKKSSDYETSTNNLMKKLSDDIKKLHRNILLVEEKADHFAKVNDEKFHQVWEMNRKRCQDVLKRILETDKILHEQQLGISWTPPPHNLVNKENLPSYKDAVLQTGILSQRQSVVSTRGSHKGMKTAAEPQYEVLKANFTTEELDSNPVYRRLLKYLLKHLSDKSGFLTEKRLKMLLKPYEDQQKTLVRLDNVFASLGVYNKEDIDLLITYFLPYAHCTVCLSALDAGEPPAMISRYTSQLSNLSSAFNRADQENISILELEMAYVAVQQPTDLIQDAVKELVSSEEGSSEEPEKELNKEDSLEVACGGATIDQFSMDSKDGGKLIGKRTLLAEEKLLCQYNHPLVISSVYVLRALREFVTAHYEGKDGLPTTGERLQKKRLTISRLLSEEDIKMYWERFTTVFSEDRIRVWDALAEGLTKYHEILKDRKAVCEEVVVLRRHNEDLKRLLANYLEEGQYAIPPCAVEHEPGKKTKLPPITNTKL